MHYLSAVLLAAAPTIVPAAPEPAAEVPAPDEVVVTARRESEFDLARLARAQATFEKHRSAFAPGARLYFELRPSNGVSLRDFRIHLRSGAEALEIPVDAAHRFTLPAIPKGSRLLHNRGRQQVALRALVLSPGADEGDRPLGDLRLQCRVGRALNGNEMSFKERLVFDLTGACSSRQVVLHFYTPRPLAAAAVERGTAWQPLAVDWDGHRYVVPANDRTLPNAARVRLRYRR